MYYELDYEDVKRIGFDEVSGNSETIQKNRLIIKGQELYDEYHLQIEKPISLYISYKKKPEIVEVSDGLNQSL